MPIVTPLEAYYDSLRSEAERLAGGLNDLAQRATVYHHLYEHSGGNHIFPLIAAHGAMWARGYFGFGMKLGWCCSWQYAFSPKKRLARLEQLADFANAFREINRQVCVETYTSYHFTEKYGEHPDADQFIPVAILSVLNRCHAACREGRELSNREKREVFHAFFLNEQEEVVGPRIDEAKEAFAWPLMKFMALRPLIRFAYFGRRPFFFRDFSNKEERIKKGLRAFDIAAELGWDGVEAALRSYEILPEAFFTCSAKYFDDVRESVLAAA